MEKLKREQISNILLAARKDNLEKNVGYKRLKKIKYDLHCGRFDSIINDALWFGLLDTLKVLKEEGIDFSKTYTAIALTYPYTKSSEKLYSKYPLIQALESSYLDSMPTHKLEIIKFLVEDCSSDVNFKERNFDGSFNAPIIASIRSDLDIIKYLVEKKANVKIENANLLHKVISYPNIDNKNYLEKIKYLLSCGVDANEVDENKNTPILSGINYKGTKSVSLEVRENEEKMVLEAIKILMKISSYDFKNDDYLERAILLGRPLITSLLLENGASMETLKEVISRVEKAKDLEEIKDLTSFIDERFFTIKENISSVKKLVL